jgi:hypothetical protein
MRLEPSLRQGVLAFVCTLLNGLRTAVAGLGSFVACLLGRFAGGFLTSFDSTILLAN